MRLRLYIYCEKNYSKKLVKKSVKKYFTQFLSDFQVIFKWFIKQFLNIYKCLKIHQLNIYREKPKKKYEKLMKIIKISLKKRNIKSNNKQYGLQRYKNPPDEKARLVEKRKKIQNMEK